MVDQITTWSARDYVREGAAAIDPEVPEALLVIGPRSLSLASSCHLSRVNLCARSLGKKFDQHGRKQTDRQKTRNTYEGGDEEPQGKGTQAYGLHARKA